MEDSINSTKKGLAQLAPGSVGQKNTFKRAVNHLEEGIKAIAKRQKNTQELQIGPIMGGLPHRHMTQTTWNLVQTMKKGSKRPRRRQRGEPPKSVEQVVVMASGSPAIGASLHLVAQ